MNAIETLRRLAGIRNHGDYHALAEAMHATDWPALLAEVSRLQAIVDKVPKTADGVPLAIDTDGTMVVWGQDGRHMRATVSASDADGFAEYELSECYSTREAAEAAAKRKDGDQ